MERVYLSTTYRLFSSECRDTEMPCAARHQLAGAFHPVTMPSTQKGATEPAMHPYRFLVIFPKSRRSVLQMKPHGRRSPDTVTRRTMRARGQSSYREAAFSSSSRFSSGSLSSSFAFSTIISLTQSFTLSTAIDGSFLNLIR